MSFVLNNYQQISLFDSLGFLSERKQKILDKSWAKPFSDHIFSNIDEMMFAPLYSDKRNSRPNAPVNVIVGALILKELNGLTDDEIRTFIGRIRNGVETIPSILRNKYMVDKMPVRGKLKTKQFFGFKVAALNFSKLMRFTQGKLKCRSFEFA